MKAIRIHEHGSAEKLRYEDAPEPELSAATDVIVKIEAAAVNHADLVVRNGSSGVQQRFPFVLGSDGAGRVAATGRDVAHLKPGDAVCVYPATGCGDCAACAGDREFACARPRVLGQTENGTYAEYVCVPARSCFPVPSALSFDEAAALPSVYPTVWRMLISRGEVQPGDVVLILGAGGGIATAALQLAVHAGARVMVASRSDQKLAKARSLGAAHVIDAAKFDAAAEARRITGKRGVDLAVDCSGGRKWTASLAALARGGRLVSCGPIAGAGSQTDVRRLFWNHLKIFGCSWADRDEIRSTLRFFDITGAKPVVDRVFALGAAAAAHRRLDAGEQFGKIVLRIH